MSAPNVTPGAESRRDRVLLALILGLQLVLSAQAIFDMQASAFGAAPVLDEESYVTWARQIAAGDWLGSRTFGQDPLYPYTLAVTFLVTGGSLASARVLQALFALLTTLLTWALAKRLFGPRAALAAAALLALYGPLYLSVAELEKASLTMLVSALFLWLVARALERPRARAWLAVGAAYGAAMLLRGNFVPLLFPLAGWIMWRGGWRAGAVALCGVAVVLAPVTLRNRAVGGEWVVTTASGGMNFFIGNGPGASGTNRALPFIRRTPQFEITDFEAEAGRRLGRPVTPAESSRFWFREGLRELAERPGWAVKLWATKALLAVNAEEVPDNYSFRCARDELMPSLWVGFIDFGVLVGLAIAGCALLSDRRARWLAVFAAGFASTLVIFFVLARYRVPLLPALAALAGHGLSELFVRMRAGTWRQARWALLGLALALPLTHVTLTQAEYSAPQRAHCHDLIGVSWLEQGRLDEAERQLRRAVELAPGDAELRYNLAVALQAQGRRDEAEQAYRATVERMPEHGQARINLALLLVQRGELTEARAHLEAATHGFMAQKAKALLEQLDRAPPAP